MDNKCQDCKGEKRFATGSPQVPWRYCQTCKGSGVTPAPADTGAHLAPPKARPIKPNICLCDLGSPNEPSAHKSGCAATGDTPQPQEVRYGGYLSFLSWLENHIQIFAYQKNQVRDAYKAFHPAATGKTPDALRPTFEDQYIGDWNAPYREHVAKKWLVANGYCNPDKSLIELLANFMKYVATLSAREAQEK